VDGKANPDNLKPEPARFALLIVTGTVPVEVSVTDCVAAELTTTSPKATLVALMLSAGIAAFSCRVKFFNSLPTLAVIVAV
jgi:hypothetical protein